jgi:hypothetical protein
MIPFAMARQYLKSIFTEDALLQILLKDKQRTLLEQPKLYVYAPLLFLTMAIDSITIRHDWIKGLSDAKFEKSTHHFSLKASSLVPLAVEAGNH